MKIAAFGFDSFGTIPDNPAQRVIEALSDASDQFSPYKIVAQTLPTQYEQAARLVRSLLDQTQPEIAIGFGVSRSRNTVCLERFAMNLDDADIADNAGSLRRGTPIANLGPAALTATADLQTVLRALRNKNIQSEISNHAGTYVCNHAYYHALDQLRRDGASTPCLFVHLPVVFDGFHTGPPTLKRWGQSELIDAAFVVVQSLINSQQTGGLGDTRIPEDALA